MSDKKISKLKGPIMVFGAGGFIGINLMIALRKYRSDVIGISQSPNDSWRIKKSGLHCVFFTQCDITNKVDLKKLLTKHKPRTVFNLAAYGAYSHQGDIERIYNTNFLSTTHILEELKKHTFCAYIHAGSQSEYGLNATRPHENSELVPNSHYAVSKVADHFLIKYYGKIENLPVAHIRFYSIYGAFEEPTRLMPSLIAHAKKGTFPPFVEKSISRDFVYIADAIEAVITIAADLKKKQYGEAYNIATGIKTTMHGLAVLTKKLFNISSSPQFATMKKRTWDVSEWVGNPTKIKKNFGWHATTNLSRGLTKLYEES